MRPIFFIMGEYKRGISTLQKGIEALMSPESVRLWQGLRSQMLQQAGLHKTIPNYIFWPEFNKANGGRGNGRVVKDMGIIIADIFRPVRPTHVLGIKDSGVPIAEEVYENCNRSDSNGGSQLLFAERYFKEPKNADGIVVVGESYKNLGQPCYFVIPYFPPGSVVLEIDDTGARGKTAIPCAKGIMSQEGVTLAGLAVGFDKAFQGWTGELERLHQETYYFPTFSVVRVAGITYDNGLDNGSGQIHLLPETEARKII